MEPSEEKKKPELSTAPNYGLSGALAKDTNVYKGKILKYNEPPEARKPDARWMIYVFKDRQCDGDPIGLWRQSAYLFGRDQSIADIPIRHPSCSSQHAVIQFRLRNGKVTPYLMDLDSSNKTKLNGEEIEPRRYIELRKKDVIMFAGSRREYVLMNEACLTEA